MPVGVLLNSRNFERKAPDDEVRERTVHHGERRGRAHGDRRGRRHL
jgi:hypothetical protein